jgi:adenylate cyclase
MVLQVGQVRRDISYNGDTINTAARIESVCNDYNQNLLISGDLYNLLKDKKEFNIKSTDKLNLKGKRKAIELYSVKEKRKKK